MACVRANPLSLGFALCQGGSESLVVKFADSDRKRKRVSGPGVGRNYHHPPHLVIPRMGMHGAGWPINLSTQGAMAAASADEVKLFVGQIPLQATQQDIMGKQAAPAKSLISDHWSCCVL